MKHYTPIKRNIRAAELLSTLRWDLRWDGGWRNNVAGDQTQRLAETRLVPATATHSALTLCQIKKQTDFKTSNFIASRFF